MSYKYIYLLTYICTNFGCAHTSWYAMPPTCSRPTLASGTAQLAITMCIVLPQMPDEDPLEQEQEDCVGQPQPDTDVTAYVTGQGHVASVDCWPHRLPSHPQAVTDMSQNRYQQPPPGRGMPGHCQPAGGLLAATVHQRLNSAGLWRRNREVRTHARRAAGSGGWWRIGRRRATRKHAERPCCGRHLAVAHALLQSPLYQALQSTHTHITATDLCQHGNWVEVLRPTRYKTGHLKDVLPSRSLSKYWTN